MNKEDLEKLQQKFRDLTETSKKYADKGYVKSTNIDFRKPETDEEEVFIKKVNFKAFLFLLFMAVIFLALFIYSFFTKTSIIVKIGSFLLTAYIGYLAFNTRKNTDLFIGKAVYKERVRKSGSGKIVYDYYVSVANEETKEIYVRNKVSELDYLRIEEGTPILISKGASKAFIYDD